MTLNGPESRSGAAVRNAGRAPVFIIAEIGSVHDGSFGNALKLITAAADCGVDAVKFQTHIAEAETVRDAPAPAYFRDEPRYEYFTRTAFSEEQLIRLGARARDCGVEFLSSPFSVAAVELLERVGIGRYKVPSGEVTNLPLLDAIGRTGRPVLLSSGMSSWSDLDDAVNVLKRHHDQITILQCTSEYPCSPGSVGLNVLGEMRDRYGTTVGLSDHTMGYAASLAAVVLGAVAIERHFAFSRLMYGSDAAHSLEVPELRQLVREIRDLEVMLNMPVEKDNLDGLREMKATFEKSIVARETIRRGERLVADKLIMLKPGTGLPARELERVLGCIATRDIPKHRLLTWDDLTAVGE